MNEASFADPTLSSLPGEIRTSRLAADRLRAAGYEVTTGIGKTGVVGLLRNGNGPAVMLRADMDALPVKEATGARRDRTDRQCRGGGIRCSQAT